MLPLLLTLVCYATFSVQSTGGNVVSGYTLPYTRGHRYYTGVNHHTGSSYQNCVSCRCLPYETCVPVNGGIVYACRSTAVNSGSVGRVPLHYLRHSPVHSARFSGIRHNHRGHHYG